MNEVHNQRWSSHRGAGGLFTVLGILHHPPMLPLYQGPLQSVAVCFSVLATLSILQHALFGHFGRGGLLWPAVGGPPPAPQLTICTTIRMISRQVLGPEDYAMLDLAAAAERSRWIQNERDRNRSLQRGKEAILLYV